MAHALQALNGGREGRTLASRKRSATFRVWSLHHLGIPPNLFLTPNLNEEKSVEKRKCPVLKKRRLMFAIPFSADLQRNPSSAGCTVLGRWDQRF